jgi:small subunit ribosomal protein S2
MAEEKLVVPIDMYLQSGIHIGAKFKTGFMQPYIYKIRPDGLCVLNISKIDERLRLAGQMLAKYEHEKILAVCRRENGHRAVKAFGKATGAKVIAGRYLPGTLTNPLNEYYLEPDIVLVSDPWLDKQVVRDAMKAGIPVIAMCDTNNTTEDIDLVVPCNNKGNKSLSIVFYILAREYLRNKGVIDKAAEPEPGFKEF